VVFTLSASNGSVCRVFVGSCSEPNVPFALYQERYGDVAAFPKGLSEKLRVLRTERLSV
jgi:hypothetical protein